MNTLIQGCYPIILFYSGLNQMILKILLIFSVLRVVLYGNTYILFVFMFKLSVIVDKFRTIVVKCILIYLLVDHYMFN